LPFGRIHFAYGQPLQIRDDDASLQGAADMLAEKLNLLEESWQ